MGNPRLTREMPMMTLSRSALGAVILTGAAAGVLFLTQLLTSENPQGEAGPAAFLKRTLRRGEKLEAQRKDLLRRYADLPKIAQALAARRLSLVEAAALVRELDRKIPIDPA